MPHATYELHVRLRRIEPPIWRTLEVPGSATLEDVHYAIQAAMGWENAHLHRFTIGKRRYGAVAQDEVRGLEDERAYALQDVVKSGASFLYEYDFGDGWEHEVKVRRVSRATKSVAPRCLAGERACPPEDCGGVPGYGSLLTALADPNRHEHAQVLAGLPRGFDPERRVARSKDLSRDMAELRRFAAEEDRHAVGPEVDDPFALLPDTLVESALALSPLQRARLVAILVGSLADQLTSALARSGPTEHASARAPRGAMPASVRRSATRRGR
jgi:hypothetical protein